MRPVLSEMKASKGGEACGESTCQCPTEHSHSQLSWLKGVAALVMVLFILLVHATHLPM